MHTKFLVRGTGSARDAFDYLLGERDAAEKPREGVEVLRGNPGMVAVVADTLDFEHKYTSGVIAWAPDDQPTDEQIEAVLDAFEKTAWAGLCRFRLRTAGGGPRNFAPGQGLHHGAGPRERGPAEAGRRCAGCREASKPGSRQSPNCTRSACREAVERVSELERQLTAALKRLSAQYETEQRIV